MGRLKMRDMKMQMKNQLGVRKKIFIRSTALYVFHTAEPPFITTENQMSIVLQFEFVE